MDGQTIAAFAVSAAVLVLLVAATCQFFRGAWLFLLAGRQAAAEDARPGALKAARRMGAVCAVACVLVASLIGYEAAYLAGAAQAAWVLAMLNNIAFVAFVVAMVWFFIVQRPSREDAGAKGRETRALKAPPAGSDVASDAGSADKGASSAASAAERRKRVASLDHLPTATILFSIALLAAMAAIGILFAL